MIYWQVLIVPVVMAEVFIYFLFSKAILDELTAPNIYWRWWAFPTYVTLEFTWLFLSIVGFVSFDIWLFGEFK